jgi:hypothetical protein
MGTPPNLKPQKQGSYQCRIILSFGEANQETVFFDGGGKDFHIFATAGLFLLTLFKRRDS